MNQLPPQDQPPQYEPVPDGLLRIVLITVGITLGLSAIAVWVVVWGG